MRGKWNEEFVQQLVKFPSAKHDDMVDCLVMAINNELRNQLKVYQKTEMTEHHIYMKIAQSTKSSANRRVLEEIAHDELRHYEYWREYTQEDIEPDRMKIWLYYLISRVFGITFGIKLMEMGEEDAQDNYEQLVESIPDIDALIQDESEHESYFCQGKPL